MKILQTSFLPDNDREPVKAKPSVPVCKYIAGQWCWKRFGEDVWEWEPELERVLLQAQAAHKKAA
jgi:hypothetical protein